MRYYFLKYILLIMSLNMTLCNSNSQDYEKLREKMVRNQIEKRGVSDKKVLAALNSVERHLFVPKEYINNAYEDSPLPIGEGQTISQPYIVAFMTEILKLDKTKKILEIGTGSGYQAAVLAEVASKVYTIELIESLGKKAKTLLKKLNYNNVEVKIGDGYQGWEEHAPFDAIIVTCSPTHIPEKLKEQLAEGGLMIIPVGPRFSQELILLKKKNGKIKQTDVIAVRFVPMKDEKGKSY
ncbi:MAG: protein-L-isoaspartate O-methyltransferase [Bacteroidetes bacterium]|nr:MAG: protein-L-isoaspartate O-methyltransferase [Bacteroidota bacterium]